MRIKCKRRCMRNWKQCSHATRNTQTQGVRDTNPLKNSYIKDDPHCCHLGSTLKPGGMGLVFSHWPLHCGWNCIRVVQNLNFVALVCFLCEPGLICNNTRQKLNSLLQTYPFVRESQHSTCQWRVTRKLQRKRSYVGSWGELQSWIVITTKCNSDLTIAQWAHITCGAATAKLIPFIHTYATILTAIVEANVPFTASRGYQVRSSKVTLKTNFYIMQKEILWRKERKPYSVTCDWYKSTLLKIKLST